MLIFLPSERFPISRGVIWGILLCFAAVCYSLAVDSEIGPEWSLKAIFDGRFSLQAFTEAFGFMLPITFVSGLLIFSTIKRSRNNEKWSGAEEIIASIALWIAWAFASVGAF